jgi:hypothetical protein
VPLSGAGKVTAVEAWFRHTPSRGSSMFFCLKLRSIEGLVEAVEVCDVGEGTRRGRWAAIIDRRGLA